MEKVLFNLSRRKVNIDNLNALEVFAKIGAWHTLDYASRVCSLDAWEIDLKCEEFLRSNLPNAHVKITDSFEEIKKTDKKFSLIVVDNSMAIYGGKNKYCEHFDLFPHVFRIMQDECILILNIIPKIEKQNKHQFPYLFNLEQLRRRKKFYSSDSPDNLTYEEMSNIYSKYAYENGFNLEWYFIQKRNLIVTYLVLKLKKKEGTILN
ncbi:MAG: hypothetical protein ABFD08_06730 [Syntrophomonas sp.]